MAIGTWTVVQLGRMERRIACAAIVALSPHFASGKDKAAFETQVRALEDFVEAAVEERKGRE